jgi:hypothetical protein
MSALGSQFKEAEITYLDTVQPIPVQFLAYPYLPLGKISLLIGDPGIGKSTIAMNIAAALSTGTPLFEADTGREPLQGKSIYLSAEDNMADTLKPRLLAAGADCSQIAVINNIGSDISEDGYILEDAIQKTKAQLVILDPLQGFIGRDADMCRAADMRRLMGGLAVMAEKHHFALLAIGHMNKATGAKSLYRGLGSIDIAASARSVMLIERSENDPQIRVLSHIKSSLAPEGPALAFRIDANSAIGFVGEYDGDADSGDFEGLDDGKRELASNIILGLLSGGPMSSNVKHIYTTCLRGGRRQRTHCQVRKKRPRNPLCSQTGRLVLDHELKSRGPHPSPLWPP